MLNQITVLAIIVIKFTTYKSYAHLAKLNKKLIKFLILTGCMGFFNLKKFLVAKCVTFEYF